MSSASECQSALNAINTAANTYKSAYDNWDYWVSEYKRQTTLAKQAYDDAEQSLINTPKNWGSNQGWSNWGVDAGRNDCESRCSGMGRHTPRGTFVNTLPSDRRWWGRSWWSPCCGKYMYDCYCSELNEGEWIQRYKVSTDAKTKWEEAQGRETSHVNSRPNPPVINVQCCINRVTCPVGARCDGNIQECQLQINQKFSQESEEQSRRSEEGYRNDILRIKTATDDIIRNLNNNLSNLNSNLTSLRNINNNRDVNTVTNEINNTFNTAKTTYENMGNLIRDILNFNAQARNFNSNTRNNSPFKTEIGINASSINSNFENARSTYSRATDIYQEIRDINDIITKDKNNIGEMNKLITANNTVIQNINSEITKINNISNEINQKKNSTRDEDVKRIQTLSTESNNILNTINGYLTTFNSNNEAIRRLFISYGPNSIYLSTATSLNNTVRETAANVIRDINTIKTTNTEIKKISDTLIAELNNYNTLLSNKRNLDTLITNFNKELETINNNITSVSNIAISSENDLKNVENIKNNILNSLNSKTIKENKNLIYDNRDSSDKILKNNIPNNSPFYNGAIQIVQNINNIIRTNEKNLENTNKLYEQLNNYYEIIENKNKIEKIIPNINSNFGNIDNLLTSAKNFVISNEEDIKSLEKIKIDAINFKNNSEFAKYLISINDLNNLINSSLKNIPYSSVFFNKANEIYNNLDIIVKKSLEQYNNLMNIINEINNNYQSKKDNFLYKNIINKDNIINIDNEKLEAIKVQEEEELNNLLRLQEIELKKKGDSDYTLYIIIGIVVLLIIIVFFVAR
jgi:hypothetical protein